ncbi:MAG: hypothetical protein AB7G37_13220 [Solirubrobacteraceae bacterium]
MIPLKDTRPGTRTAVSGALAVLAIVLAGPRPLVAVGVAFVVWVAADGVALRRGPAVAVAGFAFGALAVAIAVLLADIDAGWRTVGVPAAIGAAAAIGGLHVGLAPLARIMSFCPLPMLGGMIAVPILLWSAVGIGLLTLARAGHEIAPDATSLAATSPLIVVAIAVAGGTVARPRKAGAPSPTG